MELYQPDWPERMRSRSRITTETQSERQSTFFIRSLLPVLEWLPNYNLVAHIYPRMADAVLTYFDAHPEYSETELELIGDGLQNALDIMSFVAAKAEGDDEAALESLKQQIEKFLRASCKLMLAGVGGNVKVQLDRTETTETIAEADIFMASDRLGASTKAAFEAAEIWLAEIDLKDNE